MSVSVCVCGGGGGMCEVSVYGVEGDECGVCWICM